jgi:hypothetical protein
VQIAIPKMVAEGFVFMRHFVSSTGSNSSASEDSKSEDYDDISDEQEHETSEHEPNELAERYRFLIMTPDYGTSVHTHTPALI